MTKSLLAKIDRLYLTLSKGHKRIASFIQEHYDKAAFMTASRLGDTVGERIYSGALCHGAGV